MNLPFNPENQYEFYLENPQKLSVSHIEGNKSSFKKKFVGKLHNEKTQFLNRKCAIFLAEQNS